MHLDPCSCNYTVTGQSISASTSKPNETSSFTGCSLNLSTNDVQYGIYMVSVLLHFSFTCASVDKAMPELLLFLVAARVTSLVVASHGSGLAQLFILESCVSKVLHPHF